MNCVSTFFQSLVNGFIHTWFIQRIFRNNFLALIRVLVFATFFIPKIHYVTVDGLSDCSKTLLKDSVIDIDSVRVEHDKNVKSG